MKSSQIQMYSHLLIRLITSTSTLFSIAGLLTLWFVVSLQIVIRNFYIANVPWADEIIRLSVIWMVFLGSAAIVSEKKHIQLDVIQQWVKNQKILSFLSLLAHFSSILAVSLLFLGGYKLALDSYRQISPIIGISRVYWYGAIPLSALFIFLVLIIKLFLERRKDFSS